MTDQTLLVPDNCIDGNPFPCCGSSKPCAKILVKTPKNKRYSHGKAKNEKCVVFDYDVGYIYPLNTPDA